MVKLQNPEELGSRCPQRHSHHSRQAWRSWHWFWAGSWWALLGMSSLSSLWKLAVWQKLNWPEVRPVQIDKSSLESSWFGTNEFRRSMLLCSFLPWFWFTFFTRWVFWGFMKAGVGSNEFLGYLVTMFPSRTVCDKIECRSLTIAMDWLVFSSSLLSPVSIWEGRISVRLNFLIWSCASYCPYRLLENVWQGFHRVLFAGISGYWF